MPTGPTIVLVISLIVVISIFFAPKRGLLWKHIRMFRNRNNMSENKILFDLYKLAMNHENHFHSHCIAVIEPLETGKGNRHINKILNDLAQKGYVKNEYSDRWALTPEGLEYVKYHPMKGGL
jgi:manganese/zinc/iron transport system permease protein